MAMERTKLTTPEFLEWSERPENRDRLFELIDGEVIEKVASFTLSKIAGWILTYINMYMMKNPIGYVTGADGSYIISDYGKEQDELLGMDDSLTGYDVLPGFSLAVREIFGS